jgi:CTP synthase (UTP-ammonia lyase)
VVTLNVAVLIDLPETQPYFVATLAALEHAARAVDIDAQPAIMRTDRLNAHALKDYAAVVVGPGSPYRDPEAVLDAIRAAREQGIPLVGT